MDIIGLPLPCRFVQIIGGESKMCSAVGESIGKALHKAVSRILTDDLTCISLILHGAPSLSA